MRRRTGFTLVEVLVAMALTLFIMSILSAAFVAATSAVGDFKAASDMAERLRGATNVLRRDLAADHCYDANGNVLALSSLWGTPGAPPVPPASGFFRIYQAGAAQQLPAGPPASLGLFTNYDEGADLDGVHSFLSTNHALHYTIGLHGTLRSDFLSAWVPNSPMVNTYSGAAGGGVYQYPDTAYQDTTGVYSAQTAEVAVFLAPTGELTDPLTPPALPLYGLYRRQMLTVPTSWTQPSSVSPFSEASSVPMVGEATAAPANLQAYNTLQSLNVPVNRFWMDRTEDKNGVCVNPQGSYQPPLTGSTARYPILAESDSNLINADLLLSDVISFDVRVLVDPATHGATDFGDLFQLTDSTKPVGAYFPLVNSAFSQQNVRVFDTWTSAKDPKNSPPAYDYSTQWNQSNFASSMPIFKDVSGNPIVIKALQITLRVWDFKTKKSRQVTIVQQM